MPTIDMGAMTPTGTGVLVDKTGNIFSSMTAFNGTGTVTPSTPANCASRCTQLVNQYNLPSYIGTQVVERTDTNGAKSYECMCLFGDGKLPSVPSNYNPTQNPGIAPVKSTSTDPSKLACPNPPYSSCSSSAYALNAATAIPTASPVTSVSCTLMNQFVLESIDTILAITPFL